jgi:hypothetical protein
MMKRNRKHVKACLEQCFPSLDVNEKEEGRRSVMTIGRIN